MSTETNPAEPGCGCETCSNGDDRWCCESCHSLAKQMSPAEPDTGDVEALAKVLNEADDEALVRTNFGQLTATYQEAARAVLASDWLAAHDAEVRRTAAKETAERIEAAALELVREWTQMDGRLVLSGRDLADFRDQLADVIAGRSS